MTTEIPLGYMSVSEHLKAKINHLKFLYEFRLGSRKGFFVKMNLYRWISKRKNEEPVYP